MEWFNGTVEDAIKKALGENKVFIVYVEGEDEDSKRMLKIWNDEEVSKCCAHDKCVALKIKAGSLECNQFSQCYPVLYIPSTYFINESGIPTLIIPGYVDTEEFVRRLSQAFKSEHKKTSNCVDSEVEKGAMKEMVTDCERKQLGQKGKETCETRLDKDSAREAIKLKIEKDKAEKKAKYEKEKESQKIHKSLKKKASEVPEKTIEEKKTTRIQFRFANGSTLTKEFPSESKLSELIDEVRQVQGFQDSNINLATVYPRHQFLENEMASTLSDLNLVPSAALIVIQESSKTVTSNSSILEFIKFVLAPFIALFMYIKMILFTQKDDLKDSSSKSSSTTAESERSKTYPNDKGQMTSNSTAYKLEGKIYKFTQDDDDDDEKKTWNGNSTQQM